MTLRNLPRDYKKEYFKFLNENVYNWYQKRIKNKIKILNYDRKDVIAAKKEQKMLNKYKEYKKLHYYERKA